MHSSANVARQRAHFVIEQARAANVAFELAETRTATMQARSRMHVYMKTPRVWTGAAAEDCDSIESLCLHMPKDKAENLRTIQARLRQLREEVATNKDEKLRLEKVQLEVYERVTVMQQEVAKGEARIEELRSNLNAQTAKVEAMSVALEALQVTDKEYKPRMTEATTKEGDLKDKLAQVLTEWQAALMDAVGDGESLPCEADDAADNNNPSPPYLPAVLRG